MGNVFIYWDNSNIFISAQQVAIEREGADVRQRVRVHFRNLLALAHAGRDIEHAIAVGSIPPELRHVWNRLENEGVGVQLLERGLTGLVGKPGARGRSDLADRDVARRFRLQRKAGDRGHAHRRR